MALKKTFIVVDDHPLYRTGISALITQELGYECAGGAATPREAQDLVAAAKPDFAIIDISLRDQSGLSLVTSLKSMHPELLMLVVSMHDETIYGERAIKSGARGYIMKHQPPEELIDAIRQILNGSIAVSDNLKTRLFEGMMTGKDTIDAVQALSDREFEVFSLIGKGYSANEIAERLTLSVKTINTYQDHIKTKLKIASANELRRFALGWSNKND